MRTKLLPQAKPATRSRARLLGLVLAFVPALLIGGCASGPLVIPAGLDASTIVQRAQEASDAARYDDAIAYYRALMERYDDPAILVTGEYEIAFIEYRLGHSAEARKLLESLLERYKAAPVGSLPERYKVLAEKILAKMK